VARDFLFGFQPVLNVTTAKVHAFETECFATDQGDRLRFNLADVPCGLFTIHELFGRGTSEDNVSDLVECGFMWECGNGTYGDFVPVRKALDAEGLFPDLGRLG
jgi:hypothetical protein